MPDHPDAATAFREALRAESRRWFDATLRETGPLALFDTHTHIGQNDPDGFTQAPEELLGALDRADGARAITFPMCEPDGYGPANDAVRAVADNSGGRLAWFCRVNPHSDPVAEARRCLDLGAAGIKLHPRAEQFGLGQPSVERLVALADERQVPVLIHAGRGIPALGRDTVDLASRYREAKLILAHAAVSDLAWLTPLIRDLPNLFIDTSWWNPADLLALFALVPPGQILWASDSPYGDPVASAALQLRLALTAGLDRERITLITGGQIERILTGEEPVDLGPPPGEPGRLSLELERICSHLLDAIGRALAEGDPTEPVELARLACETRGEHAAVCSEIRHLLSLYETHRAAPWRGHVFSGGMQFLIMALFVARSPDVALP
ncbi:MAG: amidohydrolase family protein [Solirubrobacterales bacterium]|nr:amidohydrolase family protein [Solirubrobacterales bacterium]